jgi:release factor glutamine methyltransferase
VVIAASDAVVARLRAAGCVFAEDEARLLVEAAATPSALDELVGQRVAGLPLEHVLGWAEFAGLRIAVAPGVFVPRQRTEFLVREAAAVVSLSGIRPVVVDLCCGCGALGVALATTVDCAELHAADVSAAAVACARRSVSPLGGHVYEGDLYDALPAGLAGRVDVLLANVPYVPTSAIALMPPEAREYEPTVALDGGADGLDVLRRVAADAVRWLAVGGVLLVETSEEQAELAAAVFAESGLVARVASSAELFATAVVGTRA